MRKATAKAEKSAERFFGALRDVFVGVQVGQRMKAKGERSDFSLIPSPLSFSLQSGFINLLRSSFSVGSFIVPRYSLVRSSFCEWMMATFTLFEEIEAWQWACCPKPYDASIDKTASKA